MQGKLVESISQKKSIRLLFNTTKRLLLLTVLGIGLTACSGSDGGLPSAAPPDTIGPKVLNVTPAKNTVDVDINSSRITVIFDEALNEDVNVLLPYSVTLTPIASTVAAVFDESEVPVRARIKGSELIINFPNQSLKKEILYEIGIRELEDVSGNVMEQYTSTFSTTSPPLAVITPTDKSIPVSRAELIIVKFSEVMDEASLSSGFELLESLPNTTGTKSYKFLDTASPLKLSHTIVDNKSIVAYTLVDPTNPTVTKLLAKSARYTVKLSASRATTVKDVSGNALASTVVSFSTGVSDKTGLSPSKPGSVTVKTTQSSGKFTNTISWLAATPSSGTTMVYNLYVSVNGEFYKQIALNNSPLAQTSYPHSAITVGNKYKYAVSAMEVISDKPRDYGPESKFSYSSVIIPDSKPPVKLTAIAGPAVSVPDGVVELSWDSVQGKKYNLYVKKGTSGFVKLSAQSILATAARMSYPATKNSYKPGNDIRYIYAVTVLAANGSESAKTFSNTVTPFTAPAVITPSGVNKTITLTWPIWKNVNGLSYTVFESVAGGAFVSVASAVKLGKFVRGNGAVGSNNPPLAYNKGYRYKVKAVSTVGSVTRTSSFSLSSSSVTLLAPTAKPTAPTNAKAVAGDASVLVTWDIAVGKNYDYRIYQKQGTAGTFTLVKTLVKPTLGSVTIGARNNVVNIVQIAAVNANVEGVRAETVGVTPKAQKLSISAWNHSCVVKSGKLWCWGENIYGQIGNKTTSNAEQQTEIVVPITGTKWISVATGERHTCGIVNNGEMYCWGESSNGRLGNNVTRSQSVLVPTLVFKPAALAATEAVNWIQVSAGRETTCGIHSNGLGNGQLFCWGSNASDQLGIAQQPKLWAVGIPEPVISAPGLSPDTDWIEVRAAEKHTCGIRQQAGKNTLWCWGFRSGGRLGDGNSARKPDSSVELLQVVSGTSTIPETDWTSIAIGNAHSCGVRGTTNTLWCWGRNSFGQIGNSNAGFSNAVPLQESTSATDWVKVFANNNQTCGLKLSGKVSCWGANYHGQIGNGKVSRDQLTPTAVTGTNTWSAVAVGNKHTCAIAANTVPIKVLCWGTAEKFALGKIVSETSRAVQVGTATNWLSLSAGGKNTAEYMFTLGLQGSSTTANRMSAWGSNRQGMLGNGDAAFLPLQAPIAVTDTAAWKKISAGSSHACGIKANGTLYCWGTGGELGNGSFDTATPTLVGVSTDTWLTVDAGVQHSCAIKLDNSLWCWGYGGTGALGDGLSSDSINSIVTVKAPGIKWASVSAGLFFTCAIDTIGDLYCWGSNGDGQLGLGVDAVTTASVSVPTLVARIGTASWTSVSAGGSTVCATTNSGNQNLYCWGAYAFGAIGNPATNPPTQLTPQVVQTVSELAASATPWTAVSVSYAHTCARKADSSSGLKLEGSLWCWGENANGEVGKGDFDIASGLNAATRTRREKPMRVFPANATTVPTIWKDFAMGGYHSCAIKGIDNSLWCWGSNSGGQLGTGKAWRASPVLVIIP